jgi:hypothetical protein
VPIEKKFVFSLINGFEDGKWRYKNFRNFIWNNITETALTYKERNSLISQPQTILTDAAKRLRLTDKESDISKGSEIAEICLYGIMKQYYSALPVVPKIFFKQNDQDNAKGADSVHIVIENGNEFSVWFGESKFYNSIDDDRFDSVIDSVKKSLQTNKLEKENSIITNLKELDYLDLDETMRQSIRNLLSNDQSIDALKPKLHIPILLLHECQITKEQTILTPEYKKEILDFHKDRANSYFKKQIRKLKDKVFLYSEVSFHLILFPVPEKEPIIDSFIKQANVYREE